MMRYKMLGRSGLRVSELSLGVMTFGDRTAWGASREDSRAVFDAYVAAGGNFFDVANSYQLGDAERMLGEFVGERRHDFVIATKYSLFANKGDPNSGGNHRKAIVRALEGSLKRLNTDYIDLYWMHAWDGVTPTEEVMRALDDLVRAGKLLHIGFSDTPAWVVSRAQVMAELRDWTALAAIQITYNLMERGAERELLPMARALGISVTVWGALASGLLSGKYGGANSEGRLKVTQPQGVPPEKLALVDKVRAVATARGATPAQVALAWVRAYDPGVIPIIGARTASQLADNLGCLDLTLTAEEIATLNGLIAFDAGFPNIFLTRPLLDDIMFGGLRDRLDAPRPL
ncbi:MAG: aldo/keto reductase [Caulobacteraceae bacterium]|nr:aldo/keto reductase [Caulobacteraceae bacterium]